MTLCVGAAGMGAWHFIGREILRWITRFCAPPHDFGWYVHKCGQLRTWFLHLSRISVFLVLAKCNTVTRRYCSSRTLCVFHLFRRRTLQSISHWHKTFWFVSSLLVLFFICDLRRWWGHSSAYWGGHAGLNS